MIKIKNLIRFTTLTLLLAAFILWVAQSAEAAGNPSESLARWRLEADFTKARPDVLLVVETGFYEGETWVTEAETGIYLNCFVNNVQMTKSGQPAIFNGNGYIACQMLDVSAIAYQMTGIQHAVMSSGSGTFVEAVMSLAGTGQYNPIFYHPDIAFGATNVGEASLSLAVDDAEAISDYFIPDGQQHLWAEFGDSGDPRQHWPTFAVAGNDLQALPEVLEGRIFTSHIYSGLIYFGYSPDSGTFLEGEVYSVDVDPGCRGFG